MPSLQTYAVFLATAMVLLAVPGPAVLYVVTRSIEMGRSGGIASVAGITTGTIVHITLATAGLSSLILASRVAFDAVKYVGAAYLVVLGLRRLLGREEGSPAETLPPPRELHGRLYRRGVVVNVLNPKTALFFLAFLPQFVDPDRGPVALQAAVLGCVFVMIAAVSDSAYAVVSAAFADRIRGSARARQVKRYASGGIFVALGATAAAARR